MQINILEYFEQTVGLYPEKTAIIDGNKEISFKNLSISTKRLACDIVGKINKAARRPIAVFLPKSIESIIADIAITYSRNIYMNMDIKSPITRLKNIIDLINPDLIITNSANIESIKEIANNRTLLNIDDSFNNNPTIDYLVFSALDKQIDTDPYCIINTSGSTGTPKGVILNHKSFIDFTEWAIEELEIGDKEIIGSLSPSVFDIYSFELCMLMAKGSTIVILPDTMAAFPANLLKLMSEKSISFIFWVPTIMVNIANLDLLSRIPLPELKTVWFAGEVFPTKQFNYWKKQLSDTKFVNLMDPLRLLWIAHILLLTEN